MASSAPLRPWLLTLLALAFVTTVLLFFRATADKTHVALAYLLVVLVASARAGRAIGLSASVAAFLAFNFLFLPPYYTFTVAAPLDWAVLGAFLVTSLVAAQLLARARAEAASAELRATEVERLSALGAETLNAGRAEDALAAITHVIRATLHAARCEVYVREGQQGGVRLAAATGEPLARQSARVFGQPSADRLVAWVAENGQPAVALQDGSARIVSDGTSGIDAAKTYARDAWMLLLPLSVRERTVGVLTVVPERTLDLDPPQQRFLEALAYYAALGVERLRLVAEAEHADALRRADEFKNALLASVSHDLRTPLTTIKALAHEIGRDGDDRAVTIEEEADRLNRFVADLLDLSRIAGGALKVVPEINAAEDLVGAALQRVSGAVGDRQLVAALDPSDPLLLGRFDFAHSLRILVNLLENAIKFAPSRSVVEVAVRRTDGALEFQVADRGRGVPESERERIFEAFYRPADSMPDVGGTGLGLSIARGLAEAQGGTLRYIAREGGGSVFIFSAPAAEVGELERQPEGPL